MTEEPDFAAMVLEETGGTDVGSALPPRPIPPPRTLVAGVSASWTLPVRTDLSGGQDRPAELGLSSSGLDVTPLDPFTDWCLSLSTQLNLLGQRAERGELTWISPEPSWPADGVPARSEPAVLPASERWRQLGRRRGPEGSFLREARQRVNESRQGGVPVPLQAYWVTYGALSAAQLEWYYWWRTHFRAGEMLPTDLSYLFLHAYELLHGVGFKEAEEAFAALQRLWRGGRLQHPQLDHYLVDWLSDFVHYYGLTSEAARAWLDEAGRHARGDLAVHHWLERGDRQEVPPGVFHHLISYRPGQNKFYREASDQAALDALFRRAITLTDEFYQRTTGESIFERLKTKRLLQVDRWAFAGAVFEGPELKYPVATIRQYRLEGRLSKLLTQAVRHTENLARQQAGVRSLLRDVKLSTALATHLETRLFPSQPVQHVRPPLELNLQRLADLQQESEAIRARLLDEVDLEVGPASSVEPTNSEPVQTVPGAASCRPPLSAAALGLLEQLREHGWALPEERLQLPPGTFFSLLVDEVNEWASLEWGDLLLEEDGARWQVCADYRAEVEALLRPPRPVLPAPVALADPWQAFAAALLPVQLEVLHELLERELTWAELGTFTASRYALPQAVLEDLNVLALETVGDVLVDPYGDVPTLEEAYREAVRQVLQTRGSGRLERT